MEPNGNSVKRAQRDAARLANVRLAQAMMQRASASGSHKDDYHDAGYDDEFDEINGYEYDRGPPIAPLSQFNNRRVGPTNVNSSAENSNGQQRSPSPVVLLFKLDCFFLNTPLSIDNLKNHRSKTDYDDGF